MPLPTPTVELVGAEGDQFDREPSTRLVEHALRELLGQFPHNTENSHVLLKVVVLNRLYATQILDVETVARHIAGLRIDPLLANGFSQAVDLIANVRIGGKVRTNFSFATKYCSWHNPTAYAIYDGNVDACLWSYKKQDRFARFARQDLRVYETFIKVVSDFRDYYHLNSLTFKQIDKFLWRLGERILRDGVR